MNLQPLRTVQAPARNARLPILLGALTLLVLTLFGIAVWDVAGHPNAAARILDMTRSLLGGIVLVSLWCANLWGPPAMRWLKLRAPDWVYRGVFWLLVIVAILGASVALAGLIGYSGTLMERMS